MMFIALGFIGITVVTKKTKRIEKHLINVVKYFAPLCLLSGAISTITAFRYFELKSNVSYFISYTMIFLSWKFLHSKEKQLTNLQDLKYSLSKKYHNCLEMTVFKIGTMIAFLLPILEGTYQVLFFKESSYYLFGYGCEETGNVVFFLLFFSAFLNTFASKTIPVVICCVFCGLCHEWKDILQQMRVYLLPFRDIKVLNERDFSKRLVKRYRCVWNGIQLFNEIFSQTLFCLIFMVITRLFSHVNQIKILKDGMSYFEWVHRTEDFTRNIILFVGITICASKISETCKTIRNILIFMKEEILSDEKYKDLYILKRSISSLLLRDPINITAGGCLCLNKSLIFTTFGAFVSYGIILLEV